MMNDLRATEFTMLHQFVARAHGVLSEGVWGYLIGGTETETTVRRNRSAIERIALRPRVLNDVSSVSARRSLFGRDARLPIMLAPVGGLEAFDPGGARTVAEAAGSFGVPTILSSVSQVPLEEVRRATDHTAIYQLYVRGDEDWADGRVEQVMAAGFDAFCLTVDSAIYSRRERDLVNQFVKPWRSYVDASAVHYQAALSWASVARIKRKFDIPLILKGIATAEDARIALEHGVEGIIVSNHGGRQLDHGRGALDVLPEVLDAVQGRAQVTVDGGFLRGTDVVKAIAMGADAVGIGRLYCCALAAGGAAGIVRMLELLEAEIASTLGLLGVTSLADLTPDHFCREADAMNTPHVFSGFPHLDLALESQVGE